MLKSILFVALGGAVGSVARYLVARWLTGSFPWATLTVNIVGCALIGFLTGCVAKENLSPEMKLLLVTGFCGGFTTFSTFANESFALMKAGEVLTVAFYVGLSVVAGILAVYVGLQLSK